MKAASNVASAPNGGDAPKQVNEVEAQLNALQNALTTSEQDYKKLFEKTFITQRMAELFARDCRHVLELVAKNESLTEILNEIAQICDRHLSGYHCAVLAAQGDGFGIAAAPAIPDAYLEELIKRWPKANFLDDAGSPMLWERCERVPGYPEESSCWRVPLFSGTSDLVGFFILQPRNPQLASDGDRKLLETLSRLAVVAIEHRALHDKLNLQAQRDRLTGLPNRTAFQEKLTESFEVSADKRRMALLSIDLDRFKDINDTLGHWTGDVLVRAVADRLVEALHSRGFLARTGGDEFAVLLDAVDSSEEPEQIATELIRALELPFDITGYELFVTASIGMSLYPEHAEDASTLQRHADAAMYRAKERGKNQYAVYEFTCGNEALEKFELKNSLRRAIANNELEVYYQPQVDLQGTLTGMEALLRWSHPTRGLLAPVHFISLAEETGLIVPIGRWVLQEACRHAAAWVRGGAHVKVAVNVSLLQFYFADVVEQVRAALEEAALNPKYLEVELTESLVMRNSDEALRQIRELRDLGVTVAIDDFGTGYSSLSYLHQLPVDVLKIDRSFVAHSDPNFRGAFVKAITMLAHSLGLRVLAEGIENEEQMEALRQAGVDFAQGFLIGKPMSQAAAASLLGVAAETAA